MLSPVIFILLAIFFVKVNCSAPYVKSVKRVVYSLPKAVFVRILKVRSLHLCLVIVRGDLR